MNHKIELAMSAIITDQVVAEIITREVEQQVGKRVNKITPMLDSKGEYTGYQVFFDPDSAVKKPFVPTKEFRKMTYSGE